MRLTTLGYLAAVLALVGLAAAARPEQAAEGLRTGRG